VNAIGRCNAILQSIQLLIRRCIDEVFESIIFRGLRRYSYSTADLFKLIERKLGIGGFILGFG